LPAPDICLGVGSGTLSQQTAAVMVEFEKVLEKEKPDLVLVVGDVNSTLAASLATVQYRIRKNSAHRPSNVDSKETLAKLVRTFCEISKTLPIIFPCHPRTAGAEKLAKGAF